MIHSMTNSLLCCINFFIEYIFILFFLFSQHFPGVLDLPTHMFFLSAFLKTLKTTKKNQNRQTKKWKKINVADNTQTKQKAYTKNMFYIYQLLLGMRPALQYGWYTQWYTEVNWFTFPSRYQTQIISWLRAWLCVYSILLVCFILKEIKDSIANEVIKQKETRRNRERCCDESNKWLWWIFSRRGIGSDLEFI